LLCCVDSDAFEFTGKPYVFLDGLLVSQVGVLLGACWGLWNVFLKFGLVVILFLR